MKKNYPDVVLEKTDILLNELITIDFFKENDINDLTFAKQHIINFFNDKYVDSIINSSDIDEIKTDEFNDLLTEIIIGTSLFELKNKGLVDSYLDENNDEIFFLTELGKKIGDNLK